ncbi:MAG TPA: tRNA (adenosine(37)-N6)-threonylcarbamoyltransferase complex transferase subunit TsaD [Acidobacteriaceae bacterium]|jgi:N6-L-threonylcarbamoyladenine synthase|nr:tRNA (adenosine(37)-N6)-threonylcarbamoyltransferase complex transferase subunit TsaD [Acidobacteriaceae bacterium]
MNLYDGDVRDELGDRLILGIESSCDETSAAVVRGGREELSNVVASQLVHASYGGVVPELASREHLRAIVPVAREAMRRAGVLYEELDAVAVTEGPGLAGALLVGITFAKALAFGTARPLIAVNHLEGHIHAVLMGTETSFAEATPILALVVSGGHTHLYLASRTTTQVWQYRNVGKTLDDAAGEAYDKVAKLLGLPYPGGPWMDALAAYGDPSAVPFSFAQIKTKVHGRPAPKLAREAGADRDERRFDMSFSGIKTAVRRHVELHGMRGRIGEREAAFQAQGLATAKAGDAEALGHALKLVDVETLNLIASFQASVAGYLTRTAMAAAEHLGARALIVSGGVAANRELRQRMAAEAEKRGLRVAFPSISLSTDNAAMIAAAAWPKLVARQFAADELEPAPQLRLG